MIDQDIKKEIVIFHKFFVDWFSGFCEQKEKIFEKNLAHKLSGNFKIIQAGGNILDAKSLIEFVRKGYGTSPWFETKIDNITINKNMYDHFYLVTYEEWQQNAQKRDLPANGRISTALIERVNRKNIPFIWHYVHESQLLFKTKSKSK